MPENTPEATQHSSPGFSGKGEVRTAYANACRVIPCGHEIEIQFGIELARQTDETHLRIKPSRCFLLNPLAAKRLATTIRAGLATQSRRNGSATSEPGAATPNPRMDNSETSEHLEKVMQLFRQVGSLNVEVELEHSFKVVRGQLSTDRLLLGIERLPDIPQLDEQIRGICNKIGMPHEHIAAFEKRLSDANHIYFGVEKSTKGLMFKAYLEYRDQIEAAIRDNEVSEASFPLFTGFKWNASDPSRQALTRYDWYPALTFSRMLDRVRHTFRQEDSQVLFDVTRGIIQRASARIPDSQVHYLEVSEEGNPRSSFDVNLYKSGHRVMDMYPFLHKAMQHYEVETERFLSVYQRLKNASFGHLAGGMDREERSFLTIYYGARKIHSSQLSSATIAPSRDAERKR